MDVVAERAVGIDVHQGMLMCTALLGPGKATQEVQRFGTMTDDLKRIRQWLLDRRITHVGMEGTGVYWMPLYALLEEGFEVIVGNARHIKNVPGRKTDVKDSAWIADLIRHGLIKKSFIPQKPFREIRYLTRYRASLVNARTADRNRLLKLLESMNIKLASVMSDVFGVSGMSMLRALADGTMTTEQMARLAKGQLRRKEPELCRALVGTLTEQQRLVLRLQLDRLAKTTAHVDEIEVRIREKLAPYKTELDLLMTIPCVDFVVASVVIAELGTDLSSFPNEDALSNWVGLCPSNNKSAGKSKGSQILPGNRYLKPVLVEAAQSVSRTGEGYLRAKFWKTLPRLGRSGAAVVVAHKLLIAAYHVLKKREPFKDLGSDYLDKLDRERTLRQLTRRAAQLGYQAKFLPLPEKTPQPEPTPAAPTNPDQSSKPAVRTYTLRPFVIPPPPQPEAAPPETAEATTKPRPERLQTMSGKRSRSKSLPASKRQAKRPTTRSSVKKRTTTRP